MSPGQAADIARNYHFWIITTFVIGYLIHVLGQAQAAASAKNNAATSVFQIIGSNWVRILVRFFVSTMLFILVWQHPQILASLLGTFGINLGTNATAVLTLPMNIGIAGLWGF